MRYREKREQAFNKNRKADKVFQWPVELGWLLLILLYKYSWMLTTMLMHCASEIKRRYRKKRDWTACPGLIKQQANITIVRKHAWFVKAQCPLLQSVPDEGEKNSKKERMEKKWEHFAFCLETQDSKKKCPSGFLILRICWFLLGKKFHWLGSQSRLSNL